MPAATHSHPHTGVRHDVPYVRGLGPVLGHEPQRVPISPSADRVPSNLSRLPPRCLDHDDAGRGENRAVPSPGFRAGAVTLTIAAAASVMSGCGDDGKSSGSTANSTSASA